MAHLLRAMVAIMEGELEEAKSRIDLALSLNPNSALAYSVLGNLLNHSGRSLEAIPVIERAMRLDPAGVPQHLHFLGTAYLLAGKYETAATLLKQRIALVPETDFSRVMLAAALGHLGDIDEARRVWNEISRDQSE